MTFLRLCLFISLCGLVTACSKEDVAISPLAQDAVILAFGDSLTYGTGANSETESYPAVLTKLTQRKVINAGVPGEITGEGLIRLNKLLEEVKPELVILCHGGNDIIQRLSKTKLKSNLAQMIELSQKQGAEVILVAVPTLGFGLSIPDLYPELATQYQLAIESDVLADVESQHHLKSDPIHPNAQGYKLIAENIFLLLKQKGAM